ncbi:hypothetical protein SKAU_G00270010 [Synaphobranchus kaupii]|uniref:SH2 domain containing 4A n=1 Tax=Synaphobranchus kaupii TaxID=118154 RepID=A0A9Q1F026_SYNKA|nr:hypothetical protein SKAU_G00270010 [Synaphobranchus kaupii]
MLQQILKDMYIDPDVLEALNEEQKKTLFLKMRQEQVRRWKEREEKMEREGGLSVRPKPRRAHCKTVSWLLGRDGDVHVCVIGEVDEFKASKLIYPGLGGRKGSSVHKNTWCQTDILKSNPVNRTSSDPVRAERENLPPASQTGIQLNLRDNTEDLKSAPHLPPLQEPKEGLDTAKYVVNTKDSSYQPHLSHGSRPMITDKLSPLDPGGKHHVPLSVATRLRPQDSQEQKNDKACNASWELGAEGGAVSIGASFVLKREGHAFLRGSPVLAPGDARPELISDRACSRAAVRGFRLVAASRRAGSEGMGLAGEGDHVVARGRVAQLMKNFNAPSNTLAPPHSKPPVPGKPAHLQMLASLSLSSSASSLWNLDLTVMLSVTGRCSHYAHNEENTV